MKEIVLKDGKTSSVISKGLIYEYNRLTILDNANYKEPIKIVIQDNVNEKLEIDVKNNVNVKLIIELSNQDSEEKTYKIDLVAHENSQLKYALISNLKAKVATLKHSFSIAKDATIDLMGGFLNDNLEAAIVINLDGKGAEINMRSIAISSDDNRQSIDVFITHKAPYTIANMTNIGIANKKGRIRINGNAKIMKGMKQANAFQTLKGIITSDDAVVELNPILLIDEFDVKAGHGATIGKIEEDVMFYLRSRGLSLIEAEKLVIHGFLAPIIDEIKDETLREKFVSVINSKI